MPNLLIEAGPGCGKTSTIIDSYLYRKNANPALYIERFKPTEEQVRVYEWVKKNFPPDCKKAVYLAYNRDIADDMSKKIHNECTANTHHGWGYYVIKKKHGFIPVSNKKGERLVQKITGTHLSDLKNKFEWISTLRYIEKLKLELLPITEENLYYLQMKYSELAPFKIHSEMARQAAQLIQEMKTFEYKLGMDYVDQVWLALFLLKEPMFEWGFVDECQDLPPLLLEFSQRLCQNLVFVGDRNQSINAWNGADPLAINRIQGVCEDTYTLKTSFRLTPDHTANANRIRPSACIKTVKTVNGITQSVPKEDTFKLLDEICLHNPLIVCRYNAPLVKLALACVRAGIPCRTLGKTVMEGLITTVENRGASSMTDLHNKLDRYEDMCLRTGTEIAKEVTRDKFAAIRYVLGYCSHPDDFKHQISSLLSPAKKTAHVTLSTVHKAKGLENDNVCILNGPIPSPRAVEPIHIEQEINTQFVGETRSKRNMYYIHY